MRRTSVVHYLSASCHNVAIVHAHIQTKEHAHVLRFDIGDEVLTGIRTYCENLNIQGAVFWAIGAVDEIEFAWYGIEEKAYTKKMFRESLEISSLTGNVSRKTEGEYAVHAHGVCTNKSMEAVGGHVMRAVVGVACEVVLEDLGPLEKAFDERTGLFLLKPCDAS